MGNSIKTAADRTSAAAGHVGTLAQQASQAADQASNSAAAMSNTYAGLKQAVVGGAETSSGIFGGGTTSRADILKEMRGYTESSASISKQELAKKLAGWLRSQNLTNSVDENSDMTQIAREVMKALPSTEKGRKVFKDDAAKQEGTCKQIAASLNDQFSPGHHTGPMALIDMNNSPEYICRRVVDLMHGYSTGIHEEFLEVQAAVKTKLQELAALREFSEAMLNKTVKILSESADNEARKKAEPFREAYERLHQETVLAIKTLEGYLHVTIAPNAEELELAMAEEGDLYKRLKSKSLTPGSSEFADAIIGAITGVGTLASVAARAQSALSTVGLQVKEFAAMSDEKDLTSWTDKHEVDAEDLAKYLAAVQTLRSLFHQREEIAKAMDSSQVLGGADESAIDRRVKQRKAERTLILRQYLERSRRAYDALLEAVKAVGPRLGKEIPVTDNLDLLRDALQRLQDRNIPRLDLALIGFYTTAPARTSRETFLEQLREVSRAVDTLVSSETYRPHSATIAPVGDAINKLIETIDFYADVVAKKYAVGGETEQPTGESVEVDHLRTPDGEIVHTVIEREDIVVEGGSEAELGDLRVAEQMRSSLDLKSAVEEFIYFFYVAKVRENLRITSSEFSEYGAKYERILGDATAGRIKEVDDEYKALLNTDGTADDSHIGAKPAASPADERWEAAKSAIEAEYQAKKKFYRVVQAMDMYMKGFSQAIISNPDEVMNIMKELSGIELIAKWFTESTGDKLAEFFDMSRQEGAAAAGAAGAGVQGQVTQQSGEHYYEAVKDAKSMVGAGGAVWATEAEGMKKAVGDSLDNYQALKNLVNTFARLGSKFGGEDIQKQTFMRPRDMYTALIEFVKASAVSTRVESVGGSYDAIIAGARQSQADAATGIMMVYPTPAVDNGSLKNRWKVESRFFQFMIKSMAAKILVVLGTFDLLERPEPIYGLVPTRMILGGDSGVTEAIPEAAELYFRLPRLAEFYLSLFKFDTTKDRQISLLSDMEGVFSGLIMQIFVKSRDVAENGEYSDSESEAIIEAINAIYRSYESHGDRAVKKILEDFVAEINRRYGLVKKADYEALQKMYNETRLTQADLSYGSENNFAILPDEDIMGRGSSKRMAPSDRYMGPGPAGATPEINYVPGDYTLDKDGTGQYRMFVEFRQKLEKLLTNKERRSDYAGTSYRSLITQSRRSMERETDRSKRVEYAHRLIQGSELVTGSDQGRSLMFHETVVVGLNVLTAIYKQLDAFRTRMLDTDVKQFSDKVKAAFATGTPTLVDLQNAIGRSTPEAQALLRDPAAGTNLAADIAPPFVDSGSTATYATASAGVTGAENALAPRLFIDRAAAMRRVVEMIFELTSDFGELVTVRFPATAGNKISLDFSKLRGMVEQLMMDVRTYINQFRGSMSADTIKRYEESDAVGSLKWLEENLMDKMIKGYRTTAGLATGDQVTLDILSRKLNDAMVELTRKHESKVIGAGAFNVAASTAEGAAYDQYGSVLSGILFWDATQANSGVAGVSTGLAANPLGGLVRGPRDPSAAAGAAVPKIQVSGADATDYIGTYTAAGIDGAQNNSMLLKFNEVLHMYLNQYYDAPSAKIFQGLIDGFANGAFSQSIMMPAYSQPDLTNTTAGSLTSFGVRGDPTSNSLVFTSIATMMQRMVKDVTTQSTSVHLVSTLSDIPSYMKESYRATLPTFNKLFDLMGKKCELVKELIQRCKIQCGRRAVAAATPAALVIDAAGTAINAGSAVLGPASTSGVTLHPLGDEAANSSSVVTQRLMNVADGISRACYTMSNISTGVLRQLGDSPMYLQTSEQSVSEYKSRYGKMPLMPLSLSLYALKAAAGELTPPDAVGAPSFSYMYGMRGLLSGEVSMDYMPGVKSILDSYNSGVTGRDRIDQAAYGRYVSNLTGALRYMVNTRTYRGLLSSAAGYSGLANDLSADASIQAYSMKKNLTDVLEVTSSSYQEERIDSMTKSIATSGNVNLADAGARETERIKNIIDMNIMPINVHALMRSIALTETYNYSYTFEQLVAMFFGRTREMASLTNVAGVGVAGAPTTTRDFFLKLMMDPYSAVNSSNIGDDTKQRGTAGFAQRMFRGDDDLMMGRPKFLSDQIFNKVMYGSLYPMAADWDESGPSGAISRGRSNWADPRTGPIPAITSASMTTLVALKTAIDGYAGAVAAGYNTSITGAALNNAATLNNSVNALLNTANTVFTQAGLEMNTPYAKGTGRKSKEFYKNLEKLRAAADKARNATAGYLSTAATAADLAKDNEAVVKAAGLKDLQSKLDKLLDSYQDARDEIDGTNSTGSGFLSVFNTTQMSRMPSGTAAQPRDIAGSVLTYIGDDNDPNKPWTSVKQVGVGLTEKSKLVRIGQGRFNSLLIRNLLFVTNTYRVVRAKLSQDLSEQRTIIQRGDSLVASTMTEYGSDARYGRDEMSTTRRFMSERSILN